MIDEYITLMSPLELFNNYLQGIGITLAVLGYIAAFNWAWAKIPGEDYPDNVFGFLLLPFIVPVAVMFLLLMPYIVYLMIFG